VGAEIAAALSRLYGAEYQIDAAARLFGSAGNLSALKSGADPATLLSGWSRAEARWRLLRAKHLIYR
jgi:hypothetical protein